MKNLKLSLFIVLFVTACNKSDVKTITNTKQKLSNQLDTVAFYAGGCQPCSSPTQPTGYTGPDDASIATYQGYGFYSDVNYDKGFFAGYNDGLAWFNSFFKAYGCTGKLKLEVRNQAGTIKLIDPAQASVPVGYYIIATENVYTCKIAGATITYVMCETANNCGPYSLKLQYQYNATYPGRTSAQGSFDNGRLQGFISATTHLPFSN